MAATFHSYQGNWTALVSRLVFSIEFLIWFGEESQNHYLQLRSNSKSWSVLKQKSLFDFNCARTTECVSMGLLNYAHVSHLNCAQVSPGHYVYKKDYLGAKCAACLNAWPGLCTPLFYYLWKYIQLEIDTWEWVSPWAQSTYQQHLSPLYSFQWDVHSNAHFPSHLHRF